MTHQLVNAIPTYCVLHNVLIKIQRGKRTAEFDLSTHWDDLHWRGIHTVHTFWTAALHGSQQSAAHPSSLIDGISSLLHTQVALLDGVGGQLHTQVALLDGISGQLHTPVDLLDGVSGQLHTQVALIDGMSSQLHTQVALLDGVSGQLHTPVV